MKYSPLCWGVVTMVMIVCSCRHPGPTDFKVASYLSYNSTELPDDATFINAGSDYDTLVLSALDLVGLPNSDIEIQRVRTFGAFSVINRFSGRRFFLYCPEFFDSVMSVTTSKKAVLSVCLHELAHHFYRHPIKPSWASYTYERQADHYSGYQMCIIGATLEESLAAMDHFGDTQDTTTHPSKKVRLADIRAGYIEAKVKIFNDTAFVKRLMQSHVTELLFAVSNSVESGTKEFAMSEFRADTSFVMDPAFIDSSGVFEKSAQYFTERLVDQSTNKGTTTEKWVETGLKSIKDPTYLLMGELISITADNKIKRVGTGEIVGRFLSAGTDPANKILDLDGVRFYIDANDIIFSVNPDGSHLELGNRLK